MIRKIIGWIILTAFFIGFVFIIGTATGQKVAFITAGLCLALTGVFMLGLYLIYDS